MRRLRDRRVRGSGRAQDFLFYVIFMTRPHQITPFFLTFQMKIFSNICQILFFSNLGRFARRSVTEKIVNPPRVDNQSA